MNKYFALFFLTFITTSTAFNSFLEKQISIFLQPGTTSALAHLGQIPAQGQTPHVTIWVHATKFLPLLSDFIHATPRPGLIHISEFPWNYRLKKLLKLLSVSDPIMFAPQHMYAFGWSGKLSFEERKNAAQLLYNAVQELDKTYQIKFKVRPKITFIAHSHGGNVVLNMANFVHDNTLKSTVILLGTPVQHATKHFVHSNFFQKIYSFYSDQDWIQLGDPQGLYINQANTNPHWELSDNIFPFDQKISQIHLKVNGDGIWHLGYIRKYFPQILPKLLKEIDEWNAAAPIVAGQERILSVITK